MEWLLPDRRLPVPPDCDLSKAADFLVSQTADYPGLTLYFDPDAKQLFDSYHVFFNIRRTKCRKRQDADMPMGPREWCLPNEVGLVHTLPDGVAMHLRLRRVGSGHRVRV